MKPGVLWCAVVCLLVAVGCGGGREEASAPSTSAPTGPGDGGPCTIDSSCTGTGSTCLTAQTIGTASSMATAPCTTGNTKQQQVEIFSWNEFIAMNWPADLSSCAPNTSASILNVKSGDNTYVTWQTYMPASGVFVGTNNTPAAWCKGNSLAAGDKRVMNEEAKAPAIAAKINPQLVLVAEPEDPVQASGPNAILTDPNGRWVRYEKLMNKTEYDYIVNNKLWQLSTLQQWQTAGTPIDLPQGTVEIKASWKVLTAQQQASGKYFTTKAIVFNTPTATAPAACDLVPVTLGLVGLHIVQNTPGNDFFFWATFEHVDNDTVFAYPSQPANQQPTPPASGVYTELGPAPGCATQMTPVNVQRSTAISAQTAALNKYYQGLLGSSVFANYQLVGTTWVEGGPGGNVPPNVANITMETFAQTNTTQFAGSTWTGCFSCHINATTPVQGQYSDHSFFFLRAQ